MHRAGVGTGSTDCCLVQPAHHGSPYRVLAFATSGGTELMEQASGVAEEMDLVSGLVRPGALQLRWTVSADDDQRHRGMAGFKDGWMEVGNCCP